MKWFIKLLGAIVLLYGLLEGSLALISIGDYSHIKLMLEESKSLADLFSYGSEYIVLMSKLVKGISLIVSGLIFGTLLLAASIIIENQETIIKLINKKVIVKGQGNNSRNDCIIVIRRSKCQTRRLVSYL